MSSLVDRARVRLRLASAPSSSPPCERGWQGGGPVGVECKREACLARSIDGGRRRLRRPALGVGPLTPPTETEPRAEREPSARPTLQPRQLHVCTAPALPSPGSRSYRLPVTMGTGDFLGPRTPWSSRRKTESFEDGDRELPRSRGAVDRVALQVGETWVEVRLLAWLARSLGRVPLGHVDAG